MNATYAEAAVFARYAESVVAAFSEAKDELATLCERIGRYHTTTGNLNRALEIYEEFTRLQKELYAAYPNNVSFKNGLAISYVKLGEINEKIEKKAEATAYYQQAAALWSQLVQSAPQYVEFKKNFQWVQNKLAKN